MKNIINKIKQRYSLLKSSLDIQKAYDYQEIMNSANLLLDNTFIFNRTWDMEKDHIPTHIPNLDFITQHKLDPEFNYMLNRFEYLYNLFFAYKATNEKKYLHKAKELILTRIKQQHFDTINIANRELDAAMRMICFLDALTILLQTECINEQETLIIIKHLETYPLFLKNNFKEKFELVNWGSIQTQSLLIILPIIDDNYIENPIYNWAKNMLEKQLDLAINPDGLLYEQSTMYHVDVLLYGMRLLKENPQFLYLSPYYHKMAIGLYHMSNNCGLIDAYGDSDFCLIHDCLLTASNLFNDIKLLNKNPKNSFSSNNLIFNDKIDNYQKQPEFTNCYYDFIDSGINTICNQTTLWFYNGPMGSGHAHAKNLSISFFDNKPIIASCGRYTYLEGIDRDNFRSEYFHNGIIIDDEPICITKDAWSYNYFGNPNKNYFKHINNHHYIEGSFYDEGNKFIKRGIFSINNNEVIFIIDEVLSKGNHYFTQTFNLYHDILPISQTPNTYTLKENINIISEQPFLIRESECSPQYNLKYLSTRLITKNHFTNHGNNAVCLGKIQACKKSNIYQSEKLLDDNYGKAFDIMTINNHKYTIICLFNEVYHGAKVLKYNEYSFHAKRIIIDHQLNKLFIMRT